MWPETEKFVIWNMYSDGTVSNYIFISEDVFCEYLQYGDICTGKNSVCRIISCYVSVGR